MRVGSLVLSLSLTVGLSYCWGSGQKEAPAQNKVVLVLFDLSESTNSPKIRKTYSENFGLILSRITHGDALVGGWITEHSGSELVLPVNKSFPPFTPPTDNPLFAPAWKKKTDSALVAEMHKTHEIIDSLLQHPDRTVLRTDILGSLVMAERVFRSFPQQRKILVIMSDMVEDSQAHNFETENLSAERINQIIERARRENSLPDLRGVKVYVAGATHRDTNRLDQIRNFWLNYFQACNAMLPRENYGGPLVRFGE